MVPYAGHDPEDKPFSTYVYGWSKTNKWRADRMFQKGMDTEQISQRLQIRELTVLRHITEARCERLGLPKPYQRKDS